MFNASSGVVHRGDCRHAENTVPWAWADRVPDLTWTDGHPSTGELVGEDDYIRRLRACRVCKPDERGGW